MIDLIKKIECTATVTFTEQNLKDIICTAFESGGYRLDYWFCAVDVLRQASTLDYLRLVGVDAEIAEDYETIPEMKEAHIEQEGELWVIDTDTIKKGITKILHDSNGCDISQYLINGQWEMIDAEGADILVQLGLFGEVVYG